MNVISGDDRVRGPADARLTAAARGKSGLTEPLCTRATRCMQTPAEIKVVACRRVLGELLVSGSKAEAR